MRKTGILLHISALPSKYGIGSFGKEAYKFVDYLDQAGQTYWQILPLGPTSYGDSPYQTFSAFALNPYFIDLDILVKEQLLKRSEILDSTGWDFKVDYEKVFNERFIVLRKAFERFNQNDEGYQGFLREHGNWLYDYALFMAIKASLNNVSWQEWPEPLKLRHNDAIEQVKVSLKRDIEFQCFMQYKAYQQWYLLKQYANSKGIKIIGDMPIYVALDSSDVWTKPEYFQLDEHRRPTLVAGVPPDNFSADGQLWGNPLYNWNVLESHEYSWWIHRVWSNTTMFDLVRIDHFIGFVNYFGIPFGDKTARNGQWYKGPSYKLFDKIKEKLGPKPIIAEDLGAITNEVRALLAHTGFPGMKLLQFAFDARETSDYLPHTYHKNVVAYTGTHDNETTAQWFKGLPKQDLAYCLAYINHQTGSKVDSLIKATLASVADTAIIPMHDYLNLGSEARFNIPSTLGGNWTWRLNPGMLNVQIKNKIYKFTKLYGRLK